MRINQVVIVPDVQGVGHEGFINGRFSEREAVDGYVSALMEHMDEDRLTCRLHEPLEPLLPNTLVIHCQAGYDKAFSKAKANISHVAYVESEGWALALMISEALSEWGKSFIDFFHKSATPRTAEETRVRGDGCIHVVVRPFKINGPNADVYMKNLSHLGKTIAYCVHEFLLSRGELPKGYGSSGVD